MRRTELSTGLVLASIHLLLVAIIYWINVEAGQSYAPILWLLLAFVDFPVSLGLGWPALQIAGDYRWNNQVMPALYLATLGTLWWFLLGTFIGALWRGIRRAFRR